MIAKQGEQTKKKKMIVCILTQYTISVMEENVSQPEILSDTNNSIERKK